MVASCADSREGLIRGPGAAIAAVRCEPDGAGCYTRLKKTFSASFRTRLRVISPPSSALTTGRWS